MRVILTICALLMPGGLLADTVFEPPQGCTKVLTVQQRSCQVMNVWRCDGGAEEWVGYFIGGGAVDHFDKYGADGDFIHSQLISSGGFMMSLRSAQDNSSISSLMDTGTDSLDMILGMNMLVVDVEIRVIGETRRTGERVVVDGEQLEVLASTLAMTAVDDTLVGEDLNVRGESKDYLLVEDRIVFEGVGKLQSSETTETFDHTPVEIIRPGEDGFFSRIPKYDCGAQVSSLTKTTPRAFDDEDRL